MAIRHSNKDKQMRQLIAQEAARIMAEQGVKDFYAAKRKAAERLGAWDTRNMPRNTEIEEALVDYQRLFQSQSQPQRLRELRAAAIKAMKLLERFEPRLVGSVLSGTAGSHSDVNLHVFADAPEEVAFLLMEAAIPFEAGDKRLRPMGNGEPIHQPTFRFLAGDVAIELTVFPLAGLRQAPRSPVNGKAMRRAALATVQALLEEEPAA